MQLCAFYLTSAKQGKAPFDSVARFHLANGATLERLNWLADTSESGVRRSFGLMANYVYRLARPGAEPRIVRPGLQRHRLSSDRAPRQAVPTHYSDRRRGLTSRARAS